MSRDTFSLRGNVHDFLLQEVIPGIPMGSSVLEIGPLVEKYSPIPQYFVDTHRILSGCLHETLDPDPDVGATYVCDVLDANQHITRTYDAIIACEVIEHVSEIWRVSEIFASLLNPAGKLFISSPFGFFHHHPRPDYWRLTADGYQLLFGKHFELQIRPYAPHGDMDDPLHYTVVGRKR